MSEYIIRNRISEMLDNVNSYLAKDTYNNKICLGIIMNLLITSMISLYCHYYIVASIPFIIIPLIMILNKRTSLYRDQINPHINRLNVLLGSKFKDSLKIEEELSFLLKCQKTCIGISLCIQLSRLLSAIGLITSVILVIVHK